MLLDTIAPVIQWSDDFSTAYDGEWHWMANTLNPYYEGNDLSEMIADDRLILDTLDQWYFGPDDTGDIMNKENIKGLQERTGQMGPVHLVIIWLLYAVIWCDNYTLSQSCQISCLVKFINHKHLLKLSTNHGIVQLFWCRPRKRHV